mmetsp:Transcript_15054/g.32650  ORF Transcript_15054/g.32650 Transcript_15054/m.32650 type:complete len:328 (+) Transcript_15054:331-1314(+)
MGNMGRANFVVEEVDGTKGVEFVVGTVDCVEGAPGEVVVFVGEVGDVNISVLEPCVKNQPSIDNNQRTTIHCHHLRNSITRCPSQGTGGHKRHTNITLINLRLPVTREELLLGLLRISQWVWPVMVSHASVRTASGSNEKIRRPTNNQMQDGLQSTPNLNSLLITKLVQKALSHIQRFVHLSVSIGISILGNMRLAQLHMVRVPMMHSMGTLPRVIRNKEQTMQNIPNRILKFLILAERSMSAFVGQHPQSHGDRPGNNRIRQPERKCQNIRRVQYGQGSETECSTKRGTDDGHGKISQTLGSLGFEAICGNDLADRARVWKVLAGE